MNNDTLSRRKLIIGCGGGAMAAVAGCASDASDDDVNGDNDGYADANGNDDANIDDDNAGDGDEEEQPDPDEVENRPEGEDVLEFDDLVIVEQELVIDEGEFSDDISVEGIVENTGDEKYDYVEVGVRIYDPDGHQLDRYFTNTQDLSGGQTWRFEIGIWEDAEDIDDYDISVSGSRYD